MLRVIKGSIPIYQLSNIFCSQSNRGPDNCIDETSTGASYYDSFLDPTLTSYLEDNKNLKGHIEYMTPTEYYESCAQIFNSTVDSLKAQRRRDKDSIDWLSNALDSGRKFNLPYVNFADKGQEGLHRMMVLGEKYGWDDYAFPVLVIEYADEHRQLVYEARRELDKCLDESMEYRYRETSLPNSFINQIQYELDKRSLDNESEYHVLLLEELDDRYVVSLAGFEDDFSLIAFKEHMRIQSSQDEEEDEDYLDDLDDLSLDDMDIEDILKSLK